MGTVRRTGAEGRAKDGPSQLFCPIIYSLRPTAVASIASRGARAKGTDSFAGCSSPRRPSGRKSPNGKLSVSLETPKAPAMTGELLVQQLWEGFIFRLAMVPNRKNGRFLVSVLRLNTGRLALKRTQVVQAATTNAAFCNQFHFFNKRGMHGENTLNAHAV